MSKLQTGLIFASLLITTIVLIDVSIFPHHTVERLAANVGVVLLFAAFYWRFFKKS